MIDLGAGVPLVVVPGIQGRWQWQRPAIEALARRGRTITYSLCGEPDSGVRLGRYTTFEAHVDQLARVLDRAGLVSAAVCGVSYGGWIALRFAARFPERVSALVLASAPGPAFLPDARQQRYIRAPRLFLPLFVMSSRHRLGPEVLAALGEPHARWQLMRRQLAAMARYPVSPTLMARRARLALDEDFAADARRVVAPTLLVTGERGLDRVVPVASTREYLVLIPGAQHRELAETGHIGIVTKPEEWADIVRGFVDSVTGTSTAAGSVRLKPDATTEGDAARGTPPCTLHDAH
jgi:pimeloyl-ACP methyl ester carboxylesterase